MIGEIDEIEKQRKKNKKENLRNQNQNRKHLMIVFKSVSRTKRFQKIIQVT